ncbi:multidrug ABC transporter permease/ATP-binding protein, partial [Vibrio cholerae O1 biovar El Tor]|nr:multidrug ABC transporter permease/ATP-binding protein [Vibrio cholerae O1 biovar El Tor]
IGGARILASLSSDIRNITIAFVYLPELTYGLILSIAAFAYLAWLSPALFAVTAGWLGLTLLVGWFFVGKVNQHIRMLREAED